MNELKAEILIFTGKELKSVYGFVGENIIEITEKTPKGSYRFERILFEYTNGEQDIVNKVEYATKIKEMTFDYINIKQRFVALFLSKLFWSGIIAIFFIVVYSEYVAMLLGYIMAVTLTKSSKVYTRYGIDRFKVSIPI
ncbi:hypothetical protein R2F61_04015 [Mollicutes bacterium LVI A0078]|nr:hypothetical protein RZE84_04035 [Mollicutes bacterium LVI A0075]WOO91728.1 hypothetical protein R2F61_04015 [Mollicutes bacterium LVI A0078]